MTERIKEPDRAVKGAGRDVDLSAIDAPDLVVVSDTATWQQLDGMQPLVAESGAPVLVIDPHRTVDPLAALTLVDIDAAAAVVISMISPAIVIALRIFSNPFKVK